MSNLVLDPDVFDVASVAADTRMVNDAVVKALRKVPDLWNTPLPQMRQERLENKGLFPLPPENPKAQTDTIPGPRGPVPVRIILPEGAPKGVYLHLHGGGWTLGSARENENLISRIAANCGLAVVSVDYALAPEDPYPAGPDDCEAAALWLVKEGAARFGTTRFAIGGESGGTTLAVTTLMRLRDRYGLTPFRAVNLTSGCYDLRMTPSVRNWGELPLVLNTLDIERFINFYLHKGGAPDHPDVSPLMGLLHDMPKALFTVGTLDPLLDDTLFMANAWLAAGNTTQLDVYPGGCHVFISFPCQIADQALKRIDAFLRDF
ncbi:MAG: alpha/beta hydrolase [Xanthobacter sp.]